MRLRTPCDHWSYGGKSGGGVCALKLSGGEPSHGWCAACPQRRVGTRTPPAPPIPLAPPSPLPYDNWPAHIKLIGSLRAEGERDVGQTATRLAGKAGKTFELWFRALTGKSCGCAERRTEWAALYPYEIRTPALLAV